ncbi:hypothetical protein BC936DRAFT_143502 [Jimgerdemannia flammicorona]|uniref:Uncharacterized protein n=1 Tax=Jimgerdemannia flammicorona TaxID=994334 RepID=A0A432ZZ50_9FUNG|nr:hypothetical protein BC936DRAFT_143502 [Jimgerdemannia flammicorona]
MAATPFAFNDASPGTRATAVAERYMIVADRCLNFVQLDHFKRHNVRTIKIKDVVSWIQGVQHNAYRPTSDSAPHLVRQKCGEVACRVYQGRCAVPDVGYQGCRPDKVRWLDILDAPS